MINMLYTLFFFFYFIFASTNQRKKRESYLLCFLSLSSLSLSLSSRAYINCGVIISIIVVGSFLIESLLDFPIKIDHALLLGSVSLPWQKRRGKWYIRPSTLHERKLKFYSILPPFAATEATYLSSSILCIKGRTCCSPYRFKFFNYHKACALVAQEVSILKLKSSHLIWSGLDWTVVRNPGTLTMVFVLIFFF